MFYRVSNICMLRNNRSGYRSMLNITAKHLFNLMFIFRAICAVFSNECIDPLEENICEEGWSPTIEPQTCIQVRHKKLTWQEARNNCLEDGADLVITYTPTFLLSMIGAIEEQDSMSFWFGLNWRPDEWDWFWSDERAVEPIDFKWDRWEPDQQWNHHKRWCTTAIFGPRILIEPIFWRDEDCEQRLRFICEKKFTSDKDCPGRELKYRSSSKCLMFSRKNLTFDEADDDCKSQGMQLLTFQAGDVPRIWRGFFEVYTYFYTAMHVKNGKVIYNDHGNYTISGLRPGIVGRTNPNQCQFYDTIGASHWANCNLRLSHICQKLSPLGPPVKPELGIVFDTGEGDAFVNRTLKVTCSTIGPRHQSLMLTTSKRPLVWSDELSYPWDLIVGEDVFISATREPFIGVNGACQYRTTFTYDILVNAHMNDMKFHCLSYSDIRKDTCDESTREKFCTSSKSITVYDDGPSRPNITLHNVASDLVVSTDSVVKATCQGQVGIDKEHTWVLIVGGKAQILQSTDPRIVFYNVIFGDDDRFASNNSAYNIYIVLVLSVNQYMHRFRLACYTTNSSRYSRDESLCVWPYHLCATTPHITVRDSILDAYWNFIASLIGLILLILVAGLLGTVVRKRNVAFSEDYLEKKGLSGTISDYRTSSSNLESSTKSFEAEYMSTLESTTDGTATTPERKRVPQQKVVVTATATPVKVQEKPAASKTQEPTKAPTNLKDSKGGTTQSLRQKKVLKKLRTKQKKRKKVVNQTVMKYKSRQVKK